MKLILAALAVLVVTLDASAQDPTAPPGKPVAPPHAGMVGSWKVDRRQLPGDQDVWKRRVDALPVDSAAPRAALPPPNPLLPAPLISGTGLDIAMLRTAMRDLLETAESLTFQLGAASVTITDDLNRARTYATSGQKETRQFAATKFDVRTRWNGQALTQDISAWNFLMTEVYLVKEDGQELLVSIAIHKPQFQPPIADIARVYSRLK